MHTIVYEKSAHQDRVQADAEEPVTLWCHKLWAKISKSINFQKKIKEMFKDNEL